MEITVIDQNVLQFFVSHRSEWLSLLMFFFTYLGNIVFVSILIILTLGYLYSHKEKTKYILPFLISVIGSVSTMYIIKLIFYKPRPLDFALYLESGYSFPSGHATIAVALYGFLIYIICKSKTSLFRNFKMIGLIVLILLIGLSRIYLGVHYFSDVLAGYTLGFIWIWIGLAISKSKLWHPQENERL